MRNRARRLQRKAGWLNSITTPMPGPENLAGHGGFDFYDWMGSHDGLAHGLGPQFQCANPENAEVDACIRDKRFNADPYTLSVNLPSALLITPSDSLEYESHPSTPEGLTRPPSPTPVPSCSVSPQLGWENEEWANDDTGPIVPVASYDASIAQPYY